MGSNPTTPTKNRMWRSLVSALVWGTRGRGFESHHPDQRKSLEIIRVPEAVNRLFDSFRSTAEPYVVYFDLHWNLFLKDEPELKAVLVGGVGCLFGLLLWMIACNL